MKYLACRPRTDKPLNYNHRANKYHTLDSQGGHTCIHVLSLNFIHALQDLAVSDHRSSQIIWVYSSDS